MRDYHINIFYSDEDAAYVADIQDLDACSALGQTAEEALNEVEKAKELWLDAARTAGKPIPQPCYRPAAAPQPSGFEAINSIATRPQGRA